jgi:myo-inositol 2-dehydrogenase / D-chiro-inositol 1-dehydrogenase
MTRPCSVPSAQALSRRVFLQQSTTVIAAAASAPLVVPARVLGADGQVAPSNRIALGMIGTGRQAVHANIPGFLKEPDAQIVAVCDVDAWRMDQARRQVETYYAGQRAAGTFQGCATFRDFRDLLARRDIDAVMISTPDHWHVPMAIAAVKAGKDVACEKPLTRSIAEGRKLSDLVTREKRVFRTDSEFRSLRTFHRAAELVRNGKIGKLQQIITATPKDSTLPAQPAMPVPEELDYELWLGPAPQAPYTEKRVHPRHEAKGRPGWLCIRDYADGMLANWGAHLNDIAMWANNTERTGPVEIEGHGTYPPAGNLWNIIQDFEVHFRFANGVRLTCKTEKPYIRFEGTEGWIQVTYPNDIEAQPESLLSWKPGPGELALPYKTSEKRDFLDAVKTRGATQADAEVGHRNTSLSHLGLLAIELGRMVRWDPAAEKCPGDDAANKRLEPKPVRAPWQT